ncbi:MAG: extracellular solute-binding protein [Anaerolineales bacterium]|nr:extracellular solute-binding protein [Anaerolineales bacterium]
MFRKKNLVILLIVTALAIMLAACKSAPPPTTVPEPTVPQDVETTQDTSSATKDVAEPTVSQPPEPTEEAARPTEKAAQSEVEQEPVTLNWWSHWAAEDNKKAVINQVIQDYELEHPNVDIEITWWQKTDMYPAMRSTFTAQEGFPDIFYIDSGAFEFIGAGWLEDLSDQINWENITPVGREAWLFAGPDGEMGNWAIPIEAFSDHILYNVKLFEELGINVPPSNQFTADEFVNVAKTCRDAGYAVFANAIGDRPTTGQYFHKFVLLHQLGHEDYLKLWNGELSWDTPAVREALAYAQQVMEIPAMPDTFTTMTLSESHRYFHTEQKACMFMVGAWYTSRAFVPEETGGQPADFKLGFLHYPEMPNGVGNNEGIYSFGGALAVASMGENKEVAIDVLNYFAQPKYGNLWMSLTAVPTGIEIDPTSMPESPWDWYFDEYNRVNVDVVWYPLPYTAECGDLQDAYVAVLNEGLPQNLITIDDGIQMIEEARAKCQ